MKSVSDEIYTEFLFVTREARVANERSEFVVSYGSILGISADDVRPSVKDLENHSTDFDE